jgi:DNA-binding response OmpR family regulator
MQGKQSILIVDDDPALLKMAGEFLRRDYAVSCAKSGYEALSLIKGDCAPDLILLDVDMPGMNGFHTLRLLRQTTSARDIPVVFLTGVNTPDAELEGLSTGAVDYITKPFRREILVARLKNHLENGLRLRQENTAEAGRLDEQKIREFSRDLNETETRVLRLIALGYTNQEISDALNYSYNYVKKVVGVIYEKKCISKRSEIKRMLS